MAWLIDFGVAVRDKQRADISVKLLGQQKY